MIEIPSTAIIPNLQSYIPKIESIIKYRFKKYLGSGNNGDAYLSNKSNIVIKVTRDKQEAMSCNYLKKFNNKLKHVYNIYDVYQIKDKVLYIIIEEKADVIDTDIATYLEDRFTGKINSNTIKDNLIDLDSLIEQTLDDIENDGGAYSLQDETTFKRFVKNKEHRKALIEASLLYSNQFFDSAMEIIENEKKYHKYIIDLMNGLLELYNINISFADIHSNNLMMRGNDLIIIDLGHSEYPKADNNLKLIN